MKTIYLLRIVVYSFFMDFTFQFLNFTLDFQSQCQKTQEDVVYCCPPPFFFKKKVYVLM